MYRFQSSLLDKFERVGYGIFRAGACGVVVSRLLCMQKASGSNPDKSNCYFVSYRAYSASKRVFIVLNAKHVGVAAIAQLGERQTEDLEVPGSIPGLGIFF